MRRCKYTIYNCALRIRDAWRAWRLSPRQTGTPQTFYIHIPKTAGTSFLHILQKHFHPAHISTHYNDYAALAAQDDARFNNYDLVCGHYPYALITRFATPPRVLVMLRDPVERTASHLRNIRTDPTFWLHQHIPAAHMSLAEILATEPGRQCVEDYQTRVLGCNFPLNVPTDKPKILFAPDNDENATLARAMQRLECADFVGITEQYADSIRLLCDTFNWPMPRRLPHLNVRRRTPKQPLTEEERAAILPLISRDRLLYTHALKIFHQRFARLSIS